MFYLIPLALFFIFYFIDKNKKDNVQNNNVQKTEINNISNAQNNINNISNAQNNINNISNAQNNINNSYTNISNVHSNINNNVVEKKKDVNIALFLGVGLIILSSIIFATTTWNSVSDISKVLILSFETLLFYVIGILLKKKFNTPKVGDSFTFISNVLIGVVFLSIGYFKLLGKSFSLNGELNYLFFSVLGIIETVAFLLRKNDLKSKNYFLILFFIMFSIYFMSLQITNNFIFSYFIISFSVFFINLFKVNLFKQNLLSFKTFNIVSMIVLSVEFIIGCFYMHFESGNMIIEEITLMLQSITLLLNMIITLYKNEESKFMSILYNGFLIFVFSCLNKDLLSLACFLFINSIILYTIHYFTQNKKMKVSSLLYCYLQGFVSIFLFCSNGKLLIAGPIISLVFIVFTILSLSKKENQMIGLNSLFQIVFVICFVFATILSLGKEKILSMYNIMLISNTITFIYFIINNVLRKKTKNLYAILLIIGFFFGFLFSIDESFLYLLTILFMNLIAYLFTLYYKDEFNNKISFYLALQFIFNLLFGLQDFELIKIIVVSALLILLYFIHNKDKRKFIFLSLLYVPFVMLLDKNVLNVQTDIKDNIIKLATLPCIINLTRNLIKPDEENVMNVIELVIFSIILFSITSDIFTIVYIMLLLVYSYILNGKYKKSSICYLNYLSIIVPILCLYIKNDRLSGFILTLGICIHIFNHILYIMLHNKRSLLFEIFHLILSFALIFNLIDSFDLSNIISAVISTGILLILNYIYDENKSKNLSLCFLFYPLILFINSITLNYEDINKILISFSFILPISIFVRKVIEVNDSNIKTIEIIALSIMFLVNIFNHDIVVAITLGIISGLLILIGYILKYKELKFLGYISLGVLVLVQTMALWQKFFWLIFLLAFGIILVAIAIYNESKKK